MALPYFIWNGIDSRDNNVIVNKLPSIERAKERVEKIMVGGRSGYLTQTEGTYEGVIKTVECTLDNGNIDYLNSWLKGDGKVTFSNESDKYYKANIINAIPYNEVIPTLQEFIVFFDCQPFKYKIDEAIITITENNSTIINEGTIESNPIIKIFGNGDLTLTINDEVITISNVEEYATIDSVLKDCYKDEILKNADMIGDFPVLKVGENIVGFTGNVTKIEVEVNSIWI